MSETRFSQAEWQVRVELAAAYRLIAQHNMDDVIYTHISARVPGETGRFLINPYGLLFHEIRASNLVKIDVDGRVLDDPSGWGVNPAGFTIHSATHMSRSDAACVLHTHTVAGVAVSCQANGLEPTNQWALQFHDRVAYHDYEAIAVDLSERERLIADLGDKPVMILRNHGLLTVGRSVAEAWKYIYNLERSCRTQLDLQASGAPLKRPDAGVCERTARQYAEMFDAIERDGEPDLEWAAFKRLLNQRHPDHVE